MVQFTFYAPRAFYPITPTIPAKNAASHAVLNPSEKNYQQGFLPKAHSESHTNKMSSAHQSLQISHFAPPTLCSARGPFAMIWHLIEARLPA